MAFRQECCLPVILQSIRVLISAEGKGYRIVGNLENTDRIMNDTFWVGVYPGMTDEMIDYMAKTIREAVNQ